MLHHHWIKQQAIQKDPNRNVDEIMEVDGQQNALDAL